MTPAQIRSALSIFLASVLLAPALAAQESDTTAIADPLPTRVFLVTAGPGGQVWERFGHNGILVDPPGGGDRFYHWGVFSFEAEDFWPRLLTGNMRYAMVSTSPDRWLRSMRGADRTVRLQEIDLTPDETRELIRFLERTDTPEERWYDYDYYLDNCSTRARDALDRVLDGAIEAVLSTEKTDHTYRWHTRRLLSPVPPAYLGIQLALGPRADRPLSLYEETFTPPLLAEHLTLLSRPGGAPLVSSDRVVHRSERFPEPEAPRSHLWLYLLTGLVAGGAVALLAGFVRAGGPWVRRSLKGLVGAWGLAAGLMGMLLALAWAFTDHTFWYGNQNLLQLNPLHLVVGAGFLFSLKESGLPRWVGRVALVVAGLSAAGLFLHTLTELVQSNGEVIALLLPVNLGVGWAAWWLERKESPTPRGAA